MNIMVARVFGCFFLMLFSLPFFGQDSIVIKGKFLNNSRYAKVVMQKFAVGIIPIAGATIYKDSFSLAIPKSIDPGVYRFQYSFSDSEHYLDLIINGEDEEISFQLDCNDKQVNPIFFTSDENKKWYTYLEQNKKQLDRINLLNQFINIYPNVTSKVYQAALQEWEEEKILYFFNLDKFKVQMKDTWAYEMVANRPYYFTDPKEDYRLQDFMKREHFWDSFNTSNSKLTNTPLFTDHILNYLRYWLNPSMNFSEEEKTNGFIKDIDKLMHLFSNDEVIRQFVYKYLSLGFKDIGEEEVLKYLDVNYKDVANQCFNEAEKTEFDKRMEGYSKMKIGNFAPNFIIKDNSVFSNSNTSKSSEIASQTDLYSIKSGRTLLVFWSSTCPHCIAELPKINELIKLHKELKVLAISLDKDPSVHQKAIDEFKDMIHSCDYKGWDAEAVKLYFIAATPTFILLDSEKRIIGKFASYEGVSKVL